MGSTALSSPSSLIFFFIPTLATPFVLFFLLFLFLLFLLVLLFLFFFFVIVHLVRRVEFHRRRVHREPLPRHHLRPRRRTSPCGSRGGHGHGRLCQGTMCYGLQRERRYPVWKREQEHVD